MWDIWEKSSDFYDALCSYYEDNDQVKCYRKEDDCDSESEADEDGDSV